MAWLSACATGPSDDAAASVCPRLIPYSAAFQAQAADELEALPPGSALEVLVADYLVTRDQLRVCQ
ncbi:hypothetical protein [Roseospirillum parvum]|uniref:hypothetical protein n=1 Tax=Roseospirillum parvum TaxID=83401 RepID=UPI001C40A611|nr:hypothetical protein [Roseospirillum parvum]